MGLLHHKKKFNTIYNELMLTLILQNQILIQVILFCLVVATEIGFVVLYSRLIKKSIRWWKAFVLAISLLAIPFGWMLLLITLLSGMVPPIISFVYIPVLIVGITSQVVRRFLSWTQLSSIFISIVGLVVGFTLLIGAIFSVLTINEHCGSTLRIYHEFNAHLKDVCIRNDFSECPRNETALRSYNETEYTKLQQCFKTKYWFDAATGRYAWVVRENGHNFVLVSHPDLPNGFGGFVTGPQSHLSEAPNWPPKVEGTWQTLLP